MPGIAELAGQRRWGTTKIHDRIDFEPVPNHSPENAPVAHLAPKKEMLSAAVYADQLFGDFWGSAGGLSYATRDDLVASMCGTQASIITRTLKWDSDFFKESCAYIPAFVTDKEDVPVILNSFAQPSKPSSSCATKDPVARGIVDDHCAAVVDKLQSATGAKRAQDSFKHGAPPSTVYDILWAEVGNQFESSVYRRSKHPAILEFEILKRSATYMHIRNKVKERFSGLEIGYSILNLYRDANDLTEFHQDNFMADGNRQYEDGEDQHDEAVQQQKRLAHNCTIGVSLGGTRTLLFRHLQSGREFRFPQGDGDLFAFTTPVNSTFQHAIPQERATAPRMSIIFWGRMPSVKLL